MVVVVLDLVDRGDVGVIQRRQHLGLAAEACHALGILSEELGQHFDRHLTSELGVFGTVHLAHATFAQLAGYLEMSQSLTDHSFTPRGATHLHPPHSELRIPDWAELVGAYCMTELSPRPLTATWRARTVPITARIALAASSARGSCGAWPLGPKNWRAP